METDLYELETKAASGNPDDIYNLAHYFIQKALNFEQNSNEFKQNLSKALDILNRIDECDNSEIFYTKSILENDLNLNNNGFDNLIKAAEMGNLKAIFNSGIYYQFENININKAIEFYQKAAEGGEKKALHQLWEIYSGTGVPDNFIPDYKKANDYLRKLAELNDAEAQVLMGRNYFSNIPDKWIPASEALNWFKKALDNGRKDSIPFIARILDDGSIDTPDFNKSKSYFEEAIKDSSIVGSYIDLARHYIDGIEIAPDINKAVSLLETGAHEADMNYRAIEELFHLYLSSFMKFHGGRLLIGKDYLSLLHWAKSYYDLPECTNKEFVYETIIKCYFELFNETDYHPSVPEINEYYEWLRKGLNSEPLARVFLGYELISGKYFNQDINNGFDYLNSAIVNNHSISAAILLGNLFRDGAPGFPPNYQQAWNCYHYEDLQEDNGPDGFNLNESRRWLESGRFLLDPQYGNNEPDGFAGLRLAANLGNDEACSELIKYMNIYGLDSIPEVNYD